LTKFSLLSFFIIFGAEFKNYNFITLRKGLGIDDLLLINRPLERHYKKVTNMGGTYRAMVY